MRLREAQYTPSVLAMLFENFIAINIADVPGKVEEIRTGQITEYMVHGCLEKKSVEENCK